MSEPRGEMTAGQMIEWIDSHPQIPLPDRRDPHNHAFMEPCGKAEGTDSCWYCGLPKREHPS